MPPSAEIIQWIERNFPKPRVDPEWLEDCTQWLEGDQRISPVTNFPEFVEAFKTQLLESDLEDSMQRGTGFDDNISTMSGHLRGPPVLVQITAITEIGASAFQLEQIRVAREERMLSGEGNEEGEEDGDVEVEGEGPMPKYPRGTLRFELTDGLMTIQAMEYRQLPSIVLGKTPLGYKMQLKGTKFQNGMAMLEPETIVFMGGKNAELDQRQLEGLKYGFYLRMGRPLPAGTINREANTEPIVLRSPLRDISPPMLDIPPHHDDVGMEPRRRLPVNSSINSIPSPSVIRDVKQERPIIALPSRNTRASVGAASDSSSDPVGMGSTAIAERATKLHPRTREKATPITTSSYFNGNAIASGSGLVQHQNHRTNTAVEGLDFNLEPTGRQVSRMLPSPEPAQSDPFDFDLLDEMDHENQRAAQNKGKARQDSATEVPIGSSTHKLPITSSTADDPSSDDYGMDDDDDFGPSLLEEIAMVEQAALQNVRSNALPASSSSGSGCHISSSKSSTVQSSVMKSFPGTAPFPPSMTGLSGQVSSQVVPEVIEIEDSDEDIEMDDKENEPVATRHVKRRINHALISEPRRAPSSSSQNKIKKLGRPIILATDPNDIIDLSDSDYSS